MDSGSNFPNAAALRLLLAGGDGQRLIQLLSRDGGAALRQAAQAVQSGDTAGAQAVIAPLLQDAETAALLQKLMEKQG